MRYATFILLLFSLACKAQDVINRTTTIEAANGVFYLVDSTLFDNGTPLPNLEVKRQLIGDTSAIARFLKDKAVAAQGALAKNIAESFNRGQVNSDFASLRSIYNQVTGGEMYTAIEEEFLDTYAGRYRVDDLQADTSFFANLIRVGADNRFRLEHEVTGERWGILPGSARNFRLQQWQGENYDMYWDGVPRKSGAIVYHTTAKIEGTPVIRIVKISNQ